MLRQRHFHNLSRLNGQPVTMEVDTGAAVSLIFEKNWKEVLSGTPLRKSYLILRTYTAEQMPVVGECQVVVQYDDQQKTLPLYVVRDMDQTSWVVHEWLRSIQLNWKSIGQVTVDTGPMMEQVRWKYS